MCAPRERLPVPLGYPPKRPRQEQFVQVSDVSHPPGCDGIQPVESDRVLAGGEILLRLSPHWIQTEYGNEGDTPLRVDEALGLGVRPLQADTRASYPSISSSSLLRSERSRSGSC